MSPDFQTIIEGAKCVTCACTDTQKFQPYTLVEKNNESYYLFQCQNCDFIFLPPYYRKMIDYHNYKGNTVLEQVRKGNNWVKVQRQKLKFDLIKKYHPTGKLMDLGCGWGHFLLAGKELGYDIYGIEISEALHEYCTKDLGLPVDALNFHDMSDEARFDVLTMWDVLEHIDEADAFLDKCHKVVKKGGHVIIQVPQIDSFIAKRLKNDWPMITLDHCNYFTHKTATQLFESKGFKVKEIQSSLEIKTFVMFMIFPWLKRRKERKQKQEEKAMTSAERQEYFNKMTSRPMWQLKLMVFGHNILYKLLSFFNIGEEMVVVAEKI